MTPVTTQNIESSPIPTGPVPARIVTTKPWLMDAGICGVLLAVTVAVYWKTIHYPFVNYDDNMYVFLNHNLHLGLSLEGIKWALTTTYFSYWHPVTWLTYLTSSTLFGIEPGPMHAINFAIHAMNAALLFVVLRTLTGLRWPALVVAALWAWHPLRVESVAWVSETKDVLAGFFWLLTILAHAHYSKKPSWGRYLMVFACLLLGMASKPTVVTLPCVLLLIDFWPLNRARLYQSKSDEAASLPGHPPQKPLWLVLEKIPMLVLSLGISILAVRVQEANNAMGLSDKVPVSLRAQNAVVSTAAYIRKEFWPVDLSVFYPHPFIDKRTIPTGTFVASAALVVIISIVVAALWRRRPAILVGWLWFLGSLAPTIGIIQAGEQAMADRYSYLSGMGFTLAFVWAGLGVFSFLTKKGISLRWVNGLGAVAAAILAAACIAATSHQVTYWRGMEPLFERAEQVIGGNFYTECALSQCRRAAGDIDGAMRWAEMARDHNPDNGRPYHELALCLQTKNELKPALAAFKAAILRGDSDFVLRNDLGGLLIELNRDDDAILQLREALRLNPAMAGAHHNLALALARKGDFAGAADEWRQAIRFSQGYGVAHGWLGSVLRRQGDRAGAIREYRTALKLGEEKKDWMIDLAWMLATDPASAPADIEQAASVAQKATTLDPADPLALDALAAALARDGQFEAAAASASSAAEKARAAGKVDLAKSIDGRVVLYKSNRPYLAQRQGN